MQLTFLQAYYTDKMNKGIILMDLVSKYLGFIGSSIEEVFDANLKLKSRFDMIKYIGLKDGLFNKGEGFLYYLTDDSERFRYAVGYSEALRFRA